MLGVAVAIGLEIAASPRTTTSATTTSGPTLRSLALAASLLLLASTVLAVGSTQTLGLAILSTLLIVLGGWLRAAAMRNLGPLFRTEAGAPELVTTGIHSVIRHPSELGFLAWVLGLFVAAPGLSSAVLAMAQLPLLGLRLYIEEADLAQRFGAAWSSHASSWAGSAWTLRSSKAKRLQSTSSVRATKPSPSATTTTWSSEIRPRPAPRTT